VGSTLGSDLPNQLQALADRSGDNRVIAGVHYEEDIAAGQTLGQALGTRFLQLATSTSTTKTALQWLWGQAKAEWAANL
jgi:hypothetical protein